MDRVWRMTRGSSFNSWWPFLTIFTVSFRPRALWHLHNTLLEQTNEDFEHLVIMDPVLEEKPDGFEWLGRVTHESAPLVRGLYVVGMGDDDDFPRDSCVQDLMDELKRLDFPDVLVVNFDFEDGQGGRFHLPTGESRKDHKFVRGQITPQCLVVRKDIWIRHSKTWLQPTDDRYSVDLGFMEAVLSSETGYTVKWSDLVFGRMPHRGLGKAESF